MNLNNVQRECIEKTDRSMAVIANAGTGKTRVLVERIRHLIEKNNYRPDQILAFTFTEKASAEMRERLLQTKVLPPADLNLISISTIHSFLSTLLRQYGTVVGLDPEFKIADNATHTLHEKLKIKKELLQEIEKNNSPLLSLFTRYGWNHFFKITYDLYQNFDFFNTPPQTIQDNFLLNFINKQKNNFLIERITQNSLSFDDLEVLGLQLLKNNPFIAKKLQDQYTQILVDEFQDTSRIQGAILEKIYNPKKNCLFIVGDPKQSIYRFRKAESQIFFDFAKTIKDHGGEVLSLETTYRLVPELCTLVNEVFEPLLSDTPYYSPLTSGKESIQSTPTLIKIPYQSRSAGLSDTIAEAEANTIANIIATKMAKEKINLNEIAILFRSGKRIPLFKEALQKRGIASAITKTTPYFSLPEGKSLFHLLYLLQNSSNLFHLAGWMQSPYFSFSENFIYWILTQKETIPEKISVSLFTTQSDQQLWELLTTQLLHWKKLAIHLEPAELFQIIISNLKKQAPSANSRLLLEQGLNLIEQWQEDCKNLALLTKKIKLFIEEEKLITSITDNNSTTGVQLITLHSAKGLEFSTVFLPQLHTSQKNSSYSALWNEDLKNLVLKDISTTSGLKITLTETEDFKKQIEIEKKKNLQEQKNLLYVGMTRAKTELYVFVKETADDLKPSAKNAMKNSNDWLRPLLNNSAWPVVPLDVSLLPTTRKISNGGLTGFKHCGQNGLDGLDGLDGLNKQNVKTFKKTHTVSSIETYYRCPREFQLKYLNNIQPVFVGAHKNLSPTLPALLRGNLLHELFQFLDFSNLSNLQTVMDQALVNQKIVNLPNETMTDLLNTIHQFQKNSELAPFLVSTADKQVLVEHPFTVDLGDYYLKGTFDRVVIDDNQVTIIDYKTDRIENNHDYERVLKTYEMQLASYSVIAKKLYPTKTIQTLLAFTDGPRIYKKLWDTQHLTAALDQINAFHLASYQTESYEWTKERDNCFRCAYYQSNYCGVKS